MGYDDEGNRQLNRKLPQTDPESNLSGVQMVKGTRTGLVNSRTPMVAPGPRKVPNQHKCSKHNGRNIWLWVKTNVGVDAPPILVYFSGDWDVHRGYDMDFDPWPFHL